MKIAVRIAQAGNQILNIIVMGIILFLFLYGGYSLWDTYMSAKSAFLSDDLLSYKPQPGEGANPSLEDLMAITLFSRIFLMRSRLFRRFPSALQASEQ